MTTATAAKTARSYIVREYYGADDYAVTAYHESLSDAADYADLLAATRGGRTELWVIFTDGSEQRIQN